jgi:mannosyltransferase
MQSDRVAFDEQIFIFQRMGGVGRYFTELVKGLRGLQASSEKPPVSIDLAFRFGVSQPAVQAGLIRSIPQLDSPRVSYALNTPWRRPRAQLLHQTYYHPRFLKVSPRVPKAMTVHDMIPERLPHLFARDPHLSKADYLRSASLVLCVSEATRSDLEELFPSLRVPVRVTPLGVGREWFREIEVRNSTTPRVTFVGAREGYKDFRVLMKALDVINAPEVTLAIVGGGPLTREEVEWVTRSRRVTVEHMSTVSDGQLREEYGRSTVFVFPSRAEGFGLPVLEAMAAGTLVVTSDAVALVEAGGGHAITFESGEADGLAAALRVALELPSTERMQRVRAAQAYAATMSWHRTAQRTLTAYEELLS